MTPAIALNQQSHIANGSLNFRQQLEDIATRVAIAADLTITFGDLEPLDVPSDLQGHLKQLQNEDCDRYLAARLQGHLYDIFNQLETDFDRTDEESDRADEESDREKDSNYVNKWSRTNFYQQLTSSNHGKGYKNSNWLVSEQVGDDWRVTKDGLTLNIQAEKHLIDPPEKIGLGNLVTIRMPPNLVTKGIYIAVGDAGLPPTEASATEDPTPIIRLYFHVNAKGALSLLDNLSQQLNTAQIPFSFKLPYSAAEFDDYNIAILELGSRDFDLVYPLVSAVYQKNRPYFQSAIPFFCQFIAPGFGLAEKPIEPHFERENMGQYYCRVLAKALIIIGREPEMTDSEKLTFLFEYVSQAGMNWDRLYLNPYSSTIYLTEFRSD